MLYRIHAHSQQGHFADRYRSIPSTFVTVLNDYNAATDCIEGRLFDERTPDCDLACILTESTGQAPEA